MTVLVTGGTGFVGAAVVRKLLDRGEAVRALARKGSDRRNLEGLEVEVVEGDLTDAASLKAACRGIRALFHVAADYRLWVPDPDAMLRANVHGSRDIIRSAAEAGAERIVYTSSVAVLGIPKDGKPGDEDTPVTVSDMIGIYKRSKFLAEEEVRRLVSDEGAPVVIVNPSTPVGPRDVKPTPTGRMIVEAASGKMPAFVDTGLNIVDVDDVADGHLLAWHQGAIGQRYVLGGENMALGAILGEIARIAGRPAPKVCIPHNVVMPIAYVAEAWARLSKCEPFATVDGVKMAKKKMFFSSDKARATLGYSPRPAAQALERAAAWFTANGYVKR